MNALNSILIEGHVVADATIATTPSGSKVCTFSIGSSRFFKRDKDTEEEKTFFDIESWGALAEDCGKHCLKGRGLRVVGRLKQDRWVDTAGKPHSKVKIVAEHVEFKPIFKAATEDGSV